MKTKATRRTLALFALGAFALGGCELIAEFDRSKIDAGSLDGSFPDVSQPDVNQPDVNQPDAPADTGTDAADAAADVVDASDGAADADAGVAALGIAPATHDYLTVATGTSTADVTFTVTNTGSATSGVPNAALSGTDASQFVIATNNCTAALAPNATCTVLVHFSPTTTGAKSASLGVSATPGGTASATLAGTGAAPAALSIAPASNPYGDQATGTSSADVTFTVTNTGGVNSGVPSPALSGTNSTEFTVATNNCTAALAPNANCTVLVHFNPTTTGAKSASLDVSATPGGTASATLTGNGVTPAQLAISPTTNTYADQPINTASSDVTFTVSNSGGATTGTLATALSGADPTQFVISTDNCVGTTLAPAATCTILVHFTPTTTGAKAASLDVTATPGGSASATLGGNGV